MWSSPVSPAGCIVYTYRDVWLSVSSVEPCSCLRRADYVVARRFLLVTFILVHWLGQLNKVVNDEAAIFRNFLDWWVTGLEKRDWFVSIPIVSDRYVSVTLTCKVWTSPCLQFFYTARYLAAQCIVIGPVCVFVCVVAGGPAVSEPYYSQFARNVCVSLSAFSFPFVASDFTRATLCYSAVFAVESCLSCCPSSHAGIVSRRLKISSNFFGLVATPLWFSDTTWLRNSNGKGNLSLRWTSDIFGLKTLNNGRVWTSCRYFFLPRYDKPHLRSLLLNSTRKPALH